MLGCGIRPAEMQCPECRFEPVGEPRDGSTNASDVPFLNILIAEQNAGHWLRGGVHKAPVLRRAQPPENRRAWFDSRMGSDIFGRKGEPLSLVACAVTMGRRGLVLVG